MNTYKIGNKAKCIIRSYAPGVIGEETILYANQPYTILKDIEFKISFTSKNVAANRAINYDRLLDYYKNQIDEITISNISLTDKIYNLLYSKNDEKLCNVSETYTSDENNKIYLNSNVDTIYQVFLYTGNGILEKAYGTLDVSDGYIEVDKASTNYLVCYSFLGTKSVLLDSTNNYYLSLDFESLGNEDDDTTRVWIHIDKCVIASENELDFSNTSNTVECKFKVINDSTTKNYITFK